MAERPIHPFLIHPHTGEPLAAVGVRKNGAPIWPILGAEDTPPAAPKVTDPVGPVPTPPAPEGFPANTPLEQMNSDQREAYWKHQARKHEDRAKVFGKLTADELAQLRAKAEKHDALELELGTTADKAAAKAADEAKAAARGELQPALIQARLDAAAARAGVTEEDLAKAVEFIDSTKFLTADGQVDTDKVKSFVSTITPATGTQQKPPARVGPSSTGQGNRGPAVARPGDTARAWLAKQGINVD